jgi:hypothetical protein
MKSRLLALAWVLLGGAVAGRGAGELVHVDEAGVIRWNSDQSEVALFGANYCLPSSSDFRAAGLVGADRKKLVEKDLAHFARMGWDGMRFSFWGDWENCDKAGNLIVNEHLDLLDYAIAEARKRGIYILFTPITTYSAWWPDGKPTDSYPGFSKYYERSELGTNPAAIAAQCNYLRQILAHINPYTGVALKDEPSILFIETINEPWHHPADFGASVAYINALADAVRSTGCRKLLFYNLSQDFRMAAAIKTSKSQGVTFAWYPTGLNAGHQLVGNYLRSVDDFVPMLRPDLWNVPKIVYEFDSPDLNSGYMYPAMARAFRGVGAQFASMFSYDMLDTAPYNLGWQTHFLNLVYSPKKAMSAVIAAEVMRTVPRYAHYGDYPGNRRFGPFRVSAEEDSSEMVTAEKYLYANDTTTAPPEPAKLRRIAGVGSSPVVDYEGCGAYFLDKMGDGLWRLEVYPDAVIVQDPFAQHLNHATVCSRLVWHAWPMTVRLPDLGDGFTVTPLNPGNTNEAKAGAGRFEARPGVYLLSREAAVDRAKLPAHLGHLGLGEFVCPPAPVLPAQIIPEIRARYAANQPATLAVSVVDAVPPQQVTIHLRGAGETAFREVPLAHQRGYRFAAMLPAGALPPGPFEYFVRAETAVGPVRYPADEGLQLAARTDPAGSPVVLFDAAQDIPALVYTRIGDTVRHGIFKNLPASGSEPAALRLVFPLSLDRSLDDYTTSLAIKERIGDAGAHLDAAKAVRIKVRGAGAGQHVFVTLVEADGTSWGTRLALSAGWQDLRVPVDQLQIAEGVKLPLGYPERWNYWIPPAQGRGGPADRLHPTAIEQVQISVRPEPALQEAKNDGGDTWADIASITLVFE